MICNELKVSLVQCWNPDEKRAPTMVPQPMPRYQDTYAERLLMLLVPQTGRDREGPTTVCKVTVKELKYNEGGEVLASAIHSGAYPRLISESLSRAQD